MADGQALSQEELQQASQRISQYVRTCEVCCCTTHLYACGAVPSASGSVRPHSCMWWIRISETANLLGRGVPRKFYHLVRVVYRAAESTELLGSSEQRQAHRK